MQITMSEQERGVVFAIVAAQPDWGGSVDALLVRDEMYDALELTRFEGKKVKLEDLSKTAKKYTVGEEAARHLLGVAAGQGNGMSLALARAIAPFVRRLKSQLEDVTSAATKNGHAKEAAAT